MPSDDQTPSPSAVATAEPTPASGPQSASAASEPPSRLFRFSDIFAEGANSPEPAPVAVVSNGATEATEADPVTAQDAESAPAEGVKAAEAPAAGTESEPPPDLETPEKPLSRREQIAAEKDARIAELEAKVAAHDPVAAKAVLRDEILAEEAQRAASVQTDEQARAKAEWFDAACQMPDSDSRLNLTVPQEWLAPGASPQTLYAWREEQKDLRARYPQAQTAIRADADRRIAAATAEADRKVAQGWTAVQKHLSEQIDKTASLPHVDPTVFAKEGVTWTEMGAHLHAAGAAWKEAELAERVTKAEADAATLKQENDELRAQALSSSRAPAVAGRTAGAAPSENGFDPSVSWRGNLRDAFGFSSNGHG